MLLYRCYHPDATILVLLSGCYLPNATTATLPSQFYHLNTTVQMLPSQHYCPDATILTLSSQCNRPGATIPMQPFKHYRHEPTIRMPLQQATPLREWKWLNIVFQTYFFLVTHNYWSFIGKWVNMTWLNFSLCRIYLETKIEIPIPERYQKLWMNHVDYAWIRKKCLLFFTSTSTVFHARMIPVPEI